MSRCASCGAPIAVPGWANTKPLDADGGPHVCAPLECPVPNAGDPLFAAAERALGAAEAKPERRDYVLREGRWLKKT